MISTLRRALKNSAKNYSVVQCRARQATCNDPALPTSADLKFLAAQTHDALRFVEVMGVLWKRLCDSPKCWRHVYKSLIVLEYLLIKGSGKVVEQCQDNSLVLNRLSNFQLFEGGVDHGLVVREAVARILKLLADPALLEEQREKAAANRGRTISTSSEAAAAKPAEIKAADRNKSRRSELLDAAPKTAADEARELQIALALSCESAAAARRQSVDGGTTQVGAASSYHVHQTAAIPLSALATQPLTADTQQPTAPQPTAELIDVSESPHVIPAARLPPPSALMGGGWPREVPPPLPLVADLPVPQAPVNTPVGGLHHDWDLFAVETSGQLSIQQLQANPFFANLSAN